MKTKKLFWEDPYMEECEATVTNINGKEVTLDQTIFYAFSGGQASDSGTIGGILVEEAIAGEDYLYKLEKEPTFQVGDKVTIKIDWNKRYKIMKLHSAAHVVYPLVEKKIGKRKIVGSNVTEEKSRLDYEYPENIGPVLPDVEKEANEIFSEDIPVKMYFDPEKPERRLWEPQNKPEWKMPCGGTHVKNLKEIGKVKLKRKNIGKGKERVEITLA